jgi:phosphoglycolate phosphatase-like HAD superfamily hydrolase
MRAEDLLTRYDHALVAFDGPIAELPPIDTDRLRVMVADARPPRKVARANDPFVILAYAATIGPATEQAVYAQLRRIEHEMVATARVVPGAREALATIATTGTQVTVVSGLVVAAVRAFLVMHGLMAHVRNLACRTGPDPAVLPPAPDLITAVIHEHAMESCVFVGSRDADLTAARAAGVRTIRYRSQPAPPEVEPTEPPPNPWFDALR